MATEKAPLPCPPEIAALDAQDRLSTFREAFDLPEGVAYFDGNSLGALTKASKERVLHTLEQAWGQDLIKSWNTHNWIDLPITVGEKIAPLIGAATGQVIACDSVSVNLYKLLSAALSLQPNRKKILSTRNNFPTDLYIASELAAQRSPNAELILSSPESLVDAIDNTVAVVMLTHVDYRSGQISDMAKLTEAAHNHGALILWDLSHSVGALPLELDQAGVDFAVGCGYKYLNGGPGAPAFAYVAKRLQRDFKQPIAGWMGHKNPFDFSPSYEPASGVQSIAAGTPPILSMAALDGALDLFSNVDIEAVRDKSIALGRLCQSLISQEPVLAELSLAAPERPEERGSQIAYRHPHAYAICQALIARNIIADFRAPNLLRIGFAPLYIRFKDVFALVKALAEILQSESYTEERFNERARVT